MNTSLRRGSTGLLWRTCCCSPDSASTCYSVPLCFHKLWFSLTSSLQKGMNKLRDYLQRPETVTYQCSTLQIPKHKFPMQTHLWLCIQTTCNRCHCSCCSPCMPNWWNEQWRTTTKLAYNWMKRSIIIQITAPFTFIFVKKISFFQID